jgi:hypothetical protein
VSRVALTIVVVALAASSGGATGGNGLPAGFTRIVSGPKGGAVWSGRIPDHEVRWDRRSSAVYLPPNYDPARRYPVVYLLHGFPGSPSGFYDSLRLAQVADGLIYSHEIRPFIGVMPVAGRATGKRQREEWTGAWEDYVVRDVVPWTDRMLSTVAAPRGRVIAGLSAGGYGAVDLALRHPRLFGVVESWEGYFKPFRDGSLAHATKRVLGAHDPSQLVRGEAPLLRRRGVTFYLSTGFNHGGIFRKWTFAFARELRGLHIHYAVWASKHPDKGAFLRLQLPAALRFAFHF